MLFLDGIGEILMCAFTSTVKDGIVRGLESRNSNEFKMTKSLSRFKKSLGSSFLFLGFTISE